MRRNRFCFVLAMAQVLTLAVTGVACSSDGSSGDDADSDGQSQDGAPVRGADVASPTVTGPVRGGRYDVPYNPIPPELAEQHGYVEEEYFLEGIATAYQAAGDWGLDGRWEATDLGSAPYTTRIVVRRPADAGDFNGTVLVEWLNVTAGMDADPDFGFTHEMLLRDGWAYVGVSAQKVGISGGSGLRIEIPGFVAQPLKEWDPARYEQLDHPGDAYSYDIFSQVAQALRRPGDTDPLDGLEPTTVIAAGESQSAMRMATYVNAVHPLADIYDGFLVHSRGASGAPLTDEPSGDPVPEVGHIRGDLDDPVLQFATESDLFFLGFVEARQDDTETLRTWEVAGTAHADQTTLDYGVASGRVWSSSDDPDFTGTCGRLNEGPQGAVLRRAVNDLRIWVDSGTAPASAAPIEVEGKIVRDEHGNARGGIRTPAVDVPTATLTGERPPGDNVFCSLFGRTLPLDALTLAALYPTPEAYVALVSGSADAAVERGFLMEADAEAFVEAAEAVRLPG